MTAPDAQPERVSLGWTAADREQVARQCDAVAHMARVLAELSEAHAIFVRAGSDTVEIVGERTAAQMEALGDWLNNMDAVQPDEDDWLNPVFAGAHRLFARALAQTAQPRAGGDEA